MHKRVTNSDTKPLRGKLPRMRTVALDQAK
jgi:hypothetical protein